MTDRRGLGDFDPGKIGISVAKLQDGDSLRVQVQADAYVEETSHSDSAIHVPCVVLEAPDYFRDMSGNEIQENEEYNIINSSSGFYNALVDAIGVENHQGQHLEIQAHQPGDEPTSRYYEITAE